MLPHFPKSRKALDELWLELASRRRLTHGPMLASIPHKMQMEGNASEFQTVQGKTNRIKYRKQSSTVSVKYEDGKGLTLEEFCAKASEIGEKMAQQMSNVLVKELDAVTTETGNEVKVSKSEGLQYKHLFELMEKTEEDFDDDGKSFSSFFCGMDFYQDVLKKMPEWEKDPEFHKRLKDLNARKRMEFREREARRRLVD
ncbi:MAG: hypothetical protein HZA89_15075 [Verrucomicrobia bacterium]|nr:hypothetical protein [Verrucomicrobiota bacterium]